MASLLNFGCAENDVAVESGTARIKSAPWAIKDENIKPGLILPGFSIARHCG
jgi:hypothetical protein